MAFGVASNASFANDKYGLEGVSNPSAAQIAAHLEQFLQGGLRPTVKSERVEDGTEGAVEGFYKVGRWTSRPAFPAPARPFLRFPLSFSALPFSPVTF